MNALNNVNDLTENIKKKQVITNNNYQNHYQVDKFQVPIIPHFRNQPNNPNKIFIKVGDYCYCYENNQIVIGIGQQGKVVKGQNCSTKEQVAIKIYNKISDEEINLMKKFQSMALKHIIQFKGNLFLDDKFYSVMELAEGDMQQFINQEEFINMNKQEKNKLFIQMLQGVQELHQLGYQHLDLKPQNFIYFKNSNKQFTVKLTDFGLAQEIRFSQIQQGTYEYMAPEILFGQEDEKYFNIDIWAMGMIWYQMITGSLLYEGEQQKVNGVKKIIQFFKSKDQNCINKIIDDNPKFQDFEKAVIKQMLKISQQRIKLSKVVEAIESQKFDQDQKQQEEEQSIHVKKIEVQDEEISKLNKTTSEFLTTLKQQVIDFESEYQQNILEMQQLCSHNKQNEFIIISFQQLFSPDFVSYKKKIEEFTDKQQSIQECQELNKFHDELKLTQNKYKNNFHNLKQHIIQQQKTQELQMLMLECEEKYNQLLNIVNEINIKIPKKETYNEVCRKINDHQNSIKNELQSLQQFKQYAQENINLVENRIKEKQFQKRCSIKQEIIKLLESKKNKLQQIQQELNSVEILVNKKFSQLQFQQEKNYEELFEKVDRINMLETLTKQIDQIKEQYNQMDAKQSKEKLQELISKQRELSIQIDQHYNQINKMELDYKYKLDLQINLQTIINYIQLYHLNRFLKRLHYHYLNTNKNQSEIQKTKINNDQQALDSQQRATMELFQKYQTELIQDSYQLSQDQMEIDQKTIIKRREELLSNIKSKNKVKLNFYIKKQNFVNGTIDEFLQKKEFTSLNFIDFFLSQAQEREHCQSIL